MILSKFRAGLEILAGYFDKDGYKVGAEHDIFYVYPTDKPLSPAHVQELIDLGWFQQDVEKDEGTGEFVAKHYNPAEGWAAFT